MEPVRLPFFKKDVADHFVGPFLGKKMKRTSMDSSKAMRNGCTFCYKSMVQGRYFMGTKPTENVGFCSSKKCTYSV